MKKLLQDKNNNLILLSIITISKNDLRGLKKTFESIKYQNIVFDRIEWVVKDGNSKDGSIDFLRGVEIKSTIRVKIITQEDKSIYDAMNIGLNNSKGQFVQFMNAGDTYFNSESLQSVFNEIKKNEDVLMVYGGHQDIFENGEIINKHPRQLDYLNYGLPTSHQAIFYNQTYINDIKYNLKYNTSADYQFTAEIFIQNRSISASIINKPIIKFFIGGNSTKKQKELLYDCFLIRREILSKSIMNSSIDYVRRWLSLLLFHNFKRIYRAFRFIIN